MELRSVAPVLAYFIAAPVVLAAAEGSTGDPCAFTRTLVVFLLGLVLPVPSQVAHALRKSGEE